MMEFTPAAGVMIVLSVLLFGAIVWALVAARNYVLATRNGDRPTPSVVLRTVMPAIAIAAVGAAMYLSAVALS